MGKTYPPGVHQEMIYEVADGEYVHTSVMSGLTPVKTQDEIVGLDESSDPARFFTLSAAERAELSSRRRAAYREHPRDGLIDEFRENNHAVEAIVSMGEQFGRHGVARTRSSWPTTWSLTVDDPDLGATTQIGVPIHLAGTPGGDPGAAPTRRPAQRRDLRRARLLRRRDRARSAGGA